MLDEIAFAGSGIDNGTSSFQNDIQTSAPKLKDFIVGNSVKTGALREFGRSMVIALITEEYWLDKGNLTERLARLGQWERLNLESRQPLDIAARAYAAIMDTSSSTISRIDYFSKVSPTRRSI